jgi:hypothetical protein
MNTNQDLSAIRDEVLQKIGRNLVNFQKIELMLKHLIANGQVSGYRNEFQKNQEKKVIDTRKKTLGTLVGEFVETTFQSNNSLSEPTAEHTEPYISFSFSVEADADSYESKSGS